MQRMRRGRVSWLLAELGVVFLGVLLALGGESAWQRRNDADRVDAYLRAIHSDMEEARRALEDARTRTRERLRTAQEQTVLLNSASPLADSLTLRGIASGGMPIIPLGNLRALVETGDLNLIRDDSLRAEIATQYAAIDRRAQFLSSLLDQGFLLTIDLGRSAAVASGGWSPNQPLKLEAVRGDPAVIGDSLALIAWFQNRLFGINSALDAVESLLEALDGV